MSQVALPLFWLSLIMLVYVYGGFVLLTALVARLRRRPVRKAPVTPEVTVIIAAWNEEQTIAERLENLLQLEYPRERLEIIVASDGSTDATERVVAGYLARGVRLLSCKRRGKVFALNDAAAAAQGEILVFSDANIRFEKTALLRLVENFADPEVGAVCGNKVYAPTRDGESSSRGERMYWQFDKWVKQLESAIGSTVSADGAIYAMRRSLYERIEVGDVTDDFAISTLAVKKGYRLVFEPRALAYEAPLAEAQREFSRKVRLMNRGLRSVILRRDLLNPLRHGYYAVALFSHKVLRRLVPVFLILLLGSNLFIYDAGLVYTLALAAQLSFYALAVAGYLLRHRRSGHFKILYIPFFYCLANCAALLATLELIAGKRIAMWQPQRH